MPNTYSVQGENESLTARLVEEGERSIELTYMNARGDSQVGVYKDGYEVSTRATLADSKFPLGDQNGNSSLYGILVAYERLGPSLRAQIPSDWHTVLGKWLAPK